jgi:tetratricopeptide (TPR) repeat protein
MNDPARAPHRPTSKKGTSIGAKIAATTAFLAAVAGLLSQIPAIVNAAKSAYCSVLSCEASTAPADLTQQDRLEKLSKAQVEGVKLIDAGKYDQAIADLESVQKELENLSTGSTEDRIQLGYTYKTYAEAFASKGQQENADRYSDFALNLFEKVKYDPTASSEEQAQAIHGIGNIKHLRGDYRQAIADYKQAISLFAETPYAWYDLFLAYEKLAERGDIDVNAMQDALARSKEIDNLAPDDVQRLEALLAKYEH